MALPFQRGLGSARRPSQVEQLGLTAAYAQDMRTRLLEDPVKYMQNVPSRNRAGAIRSLKARMDRLIATAVREDNEAYNPLQPTITRSARDAQVQGLGMMIASLESEGATEAANDRFKRDFIAWMLGKGKEEDHRKTPWYRSDWAVRTLPDVQEFVDSLVDIIYETELQLVKLITHPPRNMRDMEAYYKYVVNMDWMRKDDSFFFVDMVEFINGGSMGGGLTNSELEKYNVRQLSRKRDTSGRDAKYKYNERNTQATNDDVFKLGEDDMLIYRGRGDEDRAPHQELVLDHNRDVMVNVEGARDKLEALHKNVHNTRENVGRNAFTDTNRHTVDAGVFVKNYQTPQNEVYGEGFAPAPLAREEEEEEQRELPGEQQDEFDFVWRDDRIQEMRRRLHRHLDEDFNASEAAFEEATGIRMELETALE